MSLNRWFKALALFFPAVAAVGPSGYSGSNPTCRRATRKVTTGLIAASSAPDTLTLDQPGQHIDATDAMIVTSGAFRFPIASQR